MNRLSLSILTGAAILVAGAAHGANLGVPSSKAAAPAFSWTGCYAGTQGGLGSAHTKWQDADTPGDIDGNAVNVLENTANTDMSGAYYGGQLGCDYQFAGKWLGGDLVLGLQGMFGLSNITGTNMDQFNATWSLRDKVIGSAASLDGSGPPLPTVRWSMCGAGWPGHIISSRLKTMASISELHQRRAPAGPSVRASNLRLHQAGRFSWRPAIMASTPRTCCLLET